MQRTKVKINYIPPKDLETEEPMPEKKLTCLHLKSNRGIKTYLSSQNF